MAYPKINDVGWVFRESFDSVSSVIDNGGTLDPASTVSGGFMTCVASGVDYNKYFYWMWETGFSIMLWMQANVSVPDTTYRRFLSYRIDADHTLIAAVRRSDGTVILQLRTASGSNTLAIISGLTLNQPILLTLTYDGTNFSVYEDDSLLATTSALGGSVIGEPSSNLVLGIGKGPTASFAGVISEVQVFDRAISLEAIGDIYNQTIFSEVDDSKALVSLPLRSNYFDGSDQVTDNIGSPGGTAQLGDGTTSSTFPTQLAPHGMNFDGGDYLSLDSGIVDITSNFTVIAQVIKEDKGATSDNDRVFSFIDDADNGFQFIYDQTTGKYAVYLRIAGSNIINSLTYGSYDEERIIHLSYVVSGGTGSFYRNGVLVETDGSTSVSLGGTSGYDIGRRADGTSTGFFKGSLFKTNIFGAALTETQIKWLYSKDERLLNI